MEKQYDTMKKVAGKYSKPELQVRDKEDKLITEIHELWDKWAEDFEELLGIPATLKATDIGAAPTDLSIAATVPTIEEIRMAIR
ncbi:unnamed protein product [Schistosoma curassoni]|uniref:DHC_N2 domain-containing protein n=1 Tax=Schistosoma curassoni TaxID=6186 RepID=A0A183JHM2_9TREM|nr:unnamed protein product [Schistosoma curassoni]